MTQKVFPSLPSTQPITSGTLLKLYCVIIYVQDQNFFICQESYIHGIPVGAMSHKLNGTLTDPITITIQNNTDTEAI